MDEDNRKPWKATYLRGEQDVQVIWADDEAEARWCATNLYLHEGDTLLSLMRDISLTFGSGSSWDSSTEGSGMATVTTKIKTKPGWDANGNATLLVSERTYTDGSLDFTERDLVFYELAVRDGEVMLGRYEGTEGDCEIVYSEILSATTDTRMDYDEARCDAGLI